MKTNACARTLSLLLVLVTLCSMMAVPAFAASTTAYDILSGSQYAKTYTLSSSGKTIPYTSSDLKDRGTVTYGKSSSSYIANATDELYVMDVGVNKSGVYWAYVSYPTSSRRVYAYIPLSAISENNGSHAKTTSTGKFYCSKRATTSNSSSYYVAKGDTVYLLSTSGSKYQILYPISGGKWRIAFCDASDYQRYCGKPQSVANGTYTIVSALNNNKVIDISNASTNNGANVQLYTKNGTQAQDFELTYNASGYYTIKNVKSGKVLDVSGGVAASGTNVWQYEANGTAAQRWYLEDAGNGYYYIRSALGYYLDVSGGCTSDGTNIQIWTGNKTNSQKFKFIAKNGTSANTTSYWDSRVGSTVASIRSGDAYTKWYNSSGNISAEGGYYGQCTWYAYGRFYEVNGIQLGTARHAKYWLGDNSDNSKVRVVYGASNITAKSIAVRTTGTYGHVIFIEYVSYNSDGTPAYIYFTECNTDGNGQYNAGIDCVLQKLSYSDFVAKKNPAGYIIPA